MELATRDRLDAWWARLLGCSTSELWQSVTVRPHSALGDYDGIFAVTRGSGTHVSTPPWIDDALRETLSRQSGNSLMSPSAYDRHVPHPLRLIGPSVHAYTDQDPGMPSSVRRCTLADLGDLRAAVSQADWQEGGFDDAVLEVFAIDDSAGDLVAASNLTDFLDLPLDVGLVVRPDRRGHGLGSVVGRAATSFAVTAHGIARWCARETNLASIRTAAGLGFEPYCGQMALRRVG